MARNANGNKLIGKEFPRSKAQIFLRRHKQHATQPTIPDLRRTTSAVPCRLSVRTDVILT